MFKGGIRKLNLSPVNPKLPGLFLMLVQSGLTDVGEHRDLSTYDYARAISATTSLPLHILFP